MATRRRNCRRKTQNRHHKKVWCPTINSFKKQNTKVEIVAMCSVFKKTKQAYYKQLKTVENNGFVEEIIVGLVREKRQIWKRGSGRNLHQSLKEEFKKHHLKIGRDKFFDVLRNNHLLIKLRRFRTKTTCSFHHFNRYSYLIEGYVPERANQVWVSDITYIWLKELNKFCYLSIITDLYSRKIVGYCVYQDLSVNGCLEALRMALKQRTNKDESLIHHSDRGVQYCSHSYVNLLKKNKIEISMTQSGDPLENAVAERINKTIKEEFTDQRQMSFSSLQEAQKQIKLIVEFYNNQRPHRSIEWHTPAVAHKMKGKLERKWKTYYSKPESYAQNNK